MSLRHIIKYKEILKLNPGAISMILTLPGEPLIFSVKVPVGSRRHPLQYFRNHKWRSMLKCYFRSHLNSNIPVVFIVRFYVSPPSTENDLKLNKLKSEKVPAVKAFEVSDYLLSFLEMFHKVLIKAYRQIVKIDAVKIYSDNPRTEFQFMRYDEYCELYPENTGNPKTESKLEIGK